MPNQPSSDAMHRELYELRQRTKLLPKATAVLGRVTLLADSFMAGWIIGTTIHKVFLSSEIPAQSAAVYYASPVQRGSTIPGSPISALVAPADGWYGQGSCGAPGCLLESSEYEGQCTSFGPLEAEPPGWSWVSAPQYFPFNCGTVLLRSMPFRASPVRVDEYAGQTATQPSVMWPTGAEGTNGEAVTVTRDRMRSELENNPGSYPTLLPWLDAHLGGDSEDPTGQLVKVPGCRGDSYEACASHLDAKGLSAQRVALDFDGADLDVLPGRVVRTDPASGKQAPAASSVRVYVNPPEDLVRIPDCRGDSYQTCVSRLGNAGLTARRVELDFDAADLEVPAEGVVRTHPAKHAPTGSEITVDINPTAANMPVVIPGIQPGETYDDYAERLRELELQPLRRNTTDITFAYYADGAMSSTPGTGTRARKGTQVEVLTRPRRQRCDLSDPTDEYPVGAGQTAFERFTGDPPRYPFGANPVFLTPRNLGRPLTTLFWGTTSDVGPPVLWDGFGYRHIAAKHGWSPADEVATRTVLTNAQPISRPDRGFDRFEYVGTEYPGSDGRPCVRVVIVDYGIAPGNSQPEGIITSFGGNPR